MMARSHEKGTALVKILVATAVFVIGLLPAIASFSSAMDTQQSLVTGELLEERVRRASEKLVYHLRQAGVETLADVPDAPDVSQTISFKKQTSFDAITGAQWGPDASIAFANKTLKLSRSTTTVNLGRDLTNATFSRDGRNIHIVLRADGIGPKGDTISVVRRIHVTLEN